MTAATSRHRGRLDTRQLARLTLAGVAAYVVIDFVLALLRPGYSLIHNAESDYGRGAWYWLMDLNFLVRCALSLALARALYQAVPAVRRIRSGLALLVTWAVCSGLLAFFADDLEGQRQHGSGVVHLVLAFVAFTAMAIGAIRLSVALRSEPAWRAHATPLLAVSIAAAVAYLLLGAALKRPHGADGLYERVFLGLELLWITLAALTLASRNRTEPPG